MATADELLDGSGPDGIWDVSALTREVSIPQGAGVVAVSSDELVRPVRIRVPRWYHGTDLAGFKARVNYVNGAGQGDCYLVPDPEVGDDHIEIVWPIGRFAAAAQGDVEFSVCLVRLSEDGVTIEQEWNSVPQTFRVARGLETGEGEYEQRQDWIWEIIDACEAATGDAEAATERVNGYIDLIERAAASLEIFSRFGPATAGEIAEELGEPEEIDEGQGGADGQ